MTFTIVKPPCGRCGRTDLPVWLGDPALCDRCHEIARNEWIATTAAAALAPIRAAIAELRAADAAALGEAEMGTLA
jgi:hypothetical protein